MTIKFKPDEHMPGYASITTIPVAWGDQDAFQHVNNTVYFRWFESARIVYLDHIGFNDMLEAHGVGPILASITCNFRKQVTYPDSVYVGTRITRMGNSSLSMQHTIFSEAHSAPAADGESTLVVFDYNKQRPTPIPPHIRQAIEKLEGKPIPS